MHHVSDKSVARVFNFGIKHNSATPKITEIWLKISLNFFLKNLRMKYVFSKKKDINKY